MKTLLVSLLFSVFTVQAFATDWTVTTGSDPVVNGNNFQSVLNTNAACGDTVILTAGAEYRGNIIVPYLGACTGTDADYVTIRTSNLAGIPDAGVRITNGYGSALPKIVANSALGIPALEFAANAHHYKFIGVEVTNIGGSIVTQELIIIGKLSSGGPHVFSQRPHHITFDRCWIHETTNDTTTPSSPETTAIRGFFIDGFDITIRESRIAGFRAWTPGSMVVQASNCILFPTSALRVDVINNYLDAWFAMIFMGGSGISNPASPNIATLSSVSFNTGTHTGTATFSTVSNLAVGDIVAFRTTGGLYPSTHFIYANQPLEFQSAKVTAINGSVVDFLSWGMYDGSLTTNGSPLLQTPDSPGTAQWNGYMNQDINILRNQFVLNFDATEEVWTSSGGSSTTIPRSMQTTTGNAPKGFMEFKQAKNVLVDGNTFEGWTTGFTFTSRNQTDITSRGGAPWYGLYNVTFSNNWMKKGPNWDHIFSFPFGGILLQDNESTNERSGPWLIHNNLFEVGVENFFSALLGADNVTVTHNTYPGWGAALNANQLIFAFGSVTNNITFKDNIIPHNEYGWNCQVISPCWTNRILGGNIMHDNRSVGAQMADGPLDDDYPADFIVLSLNNVGWVDHASGGLAGHRLANGSTYKNMGTDGKDPGVDIDELIAAMGESVSTKGHVRGIVRGRKH